MRPGLFRIVAIQLSIALRASWWTVVGGCCFGASAALLLHAAVPQRYEAVARVSVPQAPAGARVAGQGEAALSAESLVDERAAIEAVRRIFDGALNEKEVRSRARDLRQRLHVQRGEGGGAGFVPVTVRYRDSDPERAARVLNTVLRVCVERAAEDGRAGDAARFVGWEITAEATVPVAPAALPRAPLVALGVLAGCLAFVGPVLTRRYLDPVISCEEGLRSLAGVPLVARIPRISTPGTKRECAARWAKNIGLSLLSAAVLVATVVGLLT